MSIQLFRPLAITTLALVVTMSGLAGTFLATTSAAAAPVLPKPTPTPIPIQPRPRPAPPTCLTDPNATLDGASIAFSTRKENKDWDTSVGVTIVDHNGTPVVSGTPASSVEFPPNTDSASYPLAVLGHTTYSAVQGGVVVIKIDPNGADTWRFGYELDLKFSDGSHVIQIVTGMDLSDENTIFDNYIT